MQFKKWLEGYEIFGFDAQSQNNKPWGKKIYATDTQHTYPVQALETSKLIKDLSKHEIEGLQSKVKFASEVHWGEGYGALRVLVNPDWTVHIDRKIKSLKGEDVWITKKNFQINRDLADEYKGFEHILAAELFEDVLEAWDSPINKPTNEFKHMTHLVVTMAEKIRRTAKSNFIMEGIKKKSNDNFIIKLGIKGAGLEDADQKRVLENNTNISYDRENGIIKIFNMNYERKVGRDMNWIPEPVDFIVNCAPDQSYDEISELIATFLKWY